MQNRLHQTLLLLLGALFSGLAFGQGRFAIAAWLAPILLLRFVHRNSRVLAIFPAVYIPLLIANWRVVPIPGVPYFVVMAMMSANITLVYLADRFAMSRIRGFAATLVFPAAWTSMELLESFMPGRATWGDIGYTQFGNVPLMQLASVTGVYGITFLITWAASAINWAWDRDSRAEAVRGLAIYASVLAAVLMLGSARIVFAPDARSVRAATIRTKPTASQDWLLDNARREARGGAKIVAWPEWGLKIDNRDVPGFLARAQRLAAEERVYLLMGLETVTPTDPKPVRNEAVLVAPNGEIALTHLKHFLVAGMEEPFTVPGDGHLANASTPFGRMTAAICYEGDFPNYIRQASRNQADLLLLPTNDWHGIEQVHFAMASFRAVENGIPVIRANTIGISAIIDPFGRAVPNGEVPLLHFRTIYGVVGDLFAWLCVAYLLLALASRALVRRAAHARPTPAVA